jgi:hypothetical protein
VGSYLTDVKQQLSLHLVSSMALGPEKGTRHELVNLALLTVPSSGVQTAGSASMAMSRVRSCCVDFLAGIIATGGVHRELRGSRHSTFADVVQHSVPDDGGGYVEMEAEEINPTPVCRWTYGEVHLPKISV